MAREIHHRQLAIGYLLTACAIGDESYVHLLVDVIAGKRLRPKHQRRDDAPTIDPRLVSVQWLPVAYARPAATCTGTNGGDWPFVRNKVWP
jgi:hypothetical protein